MWRCVMPLLMRFMAAWASSRSGWDVDVGAVFVVGCPSSEQAVGFGVELFSEADRCGAVEVEGGGDLIAGAGDAGVVAGLWWFCAVEVGEAHDLFDVAAEPGEGALLGGEVEQFCLGGGDGVAVAFVDAGGEYPGPVD